MRYEVAIPTFRRVQTLADKTLKLLVPRGVPQDSVTIFANDPDELAALKSTLDPGLYGTIVPVEPAGLRHVRNFVTGYYPEGTAILSVDDDLSDLRVRLSNQSSAPVANIHEMVTAAFDETLEHRVSLWGIYPVHNPYFMKDRVRTDLCYIIGCFWGVHNTHDGTGLVDLEDKEDYERTLKYYLRDGAVARYEWVAPVTRYYGEPGGMQETRTEERVTQSAHVLAQRFPQLATLNDSKKSGHTELRLKDLRGR